MSGERFYVPGELSPIIREVVSSTSGYVLVEAPDGLKACVREFVEGLGLTNVVFSGEHVWGPCDVGVDAARCVGAPRILHFGHYPPGSRSLCGVVRREVLGVEVFFVPVLYSGSPQNEVVDRVAEAFRGEKLIVVTTQQYFRYCKELISRLKGLLSVEGPYIMLGCECAEVRRLCDGCRVLVVSGGVFHALGTAMVVGEDNVALLDPHSGALRGVGRDLRRVVALKLNAMYRFRESSRVAVVLSLKPGQLSLESAMQIVDYLRSRGYRAELVAMREFCVEQLLNYGFDAAVNTGCPRLGIDDLDRFPIPVLNPCDAILAVEDRVSEYRPELSLITDFRVCREVLSRDNTKEGP